MSEKSYTILLTSNSSTEVKSVTIRKSWVNAALFAVSILLLILFCIFFDYIKIISTHNKSNALLSENLILKQKFELVQNKLLTVEKKIKRVEDISSKIEKVSLSLFNIKPSTNEPRHQHNDSHVDTAAIQPMGPLVASMTPMESFFKNLKFFKKAPLDKSSFGIETEKKVADVESRILKVLNDSHKKELEALENWEDISLKKNIYEVTPNLKPVTNGWYTSKFGIRKDPFTGGSRMHSGLDIAAAPGSPVLSPAAGVVSYVGFESGYGNLVTVDHGYGVKTRYAHNSEVFVKFGQKLKRGQKIAAVGNTGRSSGYHLHYEVRINGVAVDPKKFIIE